MKKLIFVMSLFLTACTDSENSVRVLQEQGFENIRITGFEFLACGRDDWYRTGFIAKKGDREVAGVVCSGLIFKDSTIRFF